MPTLKFIIYRKSGEIETGIRFGSVNYHRELLKDDEACMGGGSYVTIESKKHVLCFGDSFDFGKPQFEDLKYIPVRFQDYKLIYSYDLWDINRQDISEISNEDFEFIDD